MIHDCLHISTSADKSIVTSPYAIKSAKKLYLAFISVCTTLLFFITSSLFSQTTQTFSYTGAVQTFTVPSCVSSITIGAWGGGGGAGGYDYGIGGYGGGGQYVSSTYTVTAGQVINVYVGGGGSGGGNFLVYNGNWPTTTAGTGSVSGGWSNGVYTGGSGGGYSGTGISGGGGAGGGASYITMSGSTVLVAGGGGGGGGAGQFGTPATGGGGGQAGGSVSGCTGGGTSTYSLSVGQNGLNQSADNGGGSGGGGGYVGGGSGGVSSTGDYDACHAGGGSYYISAAGTNTIVTNGNNQLPGNTGYAGGNAAGGIPFITPNVSPADPRFSTSTYGGSGGNGYVTITYNLPPTPATIAGTATVCIGNTTSLTCSAPTGGTVTTATLSGIPYRIHTFTSSGTLTVPSGFSASAEVLVVAGGGGGGSNGGGGGGAGGLIHTFYSVSSNTIVTVGAGGAGGANSNTIGSNGSNSAFGTITTFGGSGGSSRDGWSGIAGNNGVAGVTGTGGSGGGGCGASNTNSYGATAGPGTAGQGNTGGNGTAADAGVNAAGGGGGGAGGLGTAASSTVAGNGGVGLSFSISGSAVFYAGGGGGGRTTTNATLGTGGNGGGGAGGGTLTAVSNGTANTGGGGGGGGQGAAGGTGGSGVVIVSYQDVTAGTWSSNNTGVATVSPSTGTVTTVTPVAAGTSTITFTVTNGGCTTTQSSVVTVLASIGNNTISSAQTICTGDTPATLTATTPTGGTGTYTYVWQQSTTSSTSGFANASGTFTNSTYSPGTLTVNTWYQRIVSSGSCATSTSAPIGITVSSNIATLTSFNPAVTAGTACATITQYPIYAFSLALNAAGGSRSFTGFNFVSTGTYAASDLSKFQFWQSTTDDIATATQVGTDLTPTAAGTQTFASFSKTLSASTTYYYWVTTDIANSPVIGHTLAVSAITPSNLTLSGGCITGTTTAGSVQTLSTATVDAVAQAAGKNTIFTNEALILTGAAVGGSATTGAWSVSYTSPSATHTLSSTAQVASPSTVTFTPQAAFTGTVILTLTSNGCTATDTREIDVVAPTATTLTTAGTYTWTATPPCEDETIIVKCWGGGGGGGANNNATWSSGGGGGGAYSTSTLTITAGVTYTTTVGVGGTGGPDNTTTAGTAGGDSWFGSTATILAKGGSGGSAASGSAGGAFGAGGLAASGVGTTKNSGGNGASGGGGAGGGGGEAGGSSGNGGSAGAVPSAGSGVNADGGDGGTGGVNSAGSAGSAPGGGGGGADYNGSAGQGVGGNGGAGKVIITESSLIHPVAVAGTAITVCQGVATNITTGASVSNNTSLTWTTIDGTGTFANATTLGSATYSASAADAARGTVQITLTSSTSCDNTGSLKTITVIPTPVMTNTNVATICSGTAVSIPLTSTVVSSYTWIATDNTNITGESTITQSTSTLSNTLTNTSTVVQTVVYTVTPTSTSGSCAGTAQTVTVTVIPPVTVSSANTATVCSGSTVSIPLTANVASSFTWIAANNANVTGASTTSQNTSTLSNTLTNTSTSIQSVTYTVTPTSTSGSCLGTPQTVTVTVIPTVTMSSTNTASICSGSLLSIPLTANVASSFTWIAGANVNISGSSVTTQTTSTISNTLVDNASSSQTVLYTVTPTSTNGSCAGTVQTVTVTVNPNASLNLSSAVGTNAQTLCVNTAITNITYALSGGGTGAGATGLPTGVSGSYSAGVFTISGTPTASGTFNYTVTTTGSCTQATATGTIIVTAANTAGAPSSSPTLCINTALTNITIATTGATGISNSGVSGANGLPTGVSAAWATNTITISGTPTAAGTFNYSIPLTGGCGSVNATGTIIVTAANTAGAPSSSPTLCINTALTNITIATTGATGISNDGTTGANSLPAGVSAHWSGNTITISGTPTAAGTFNYSIPLTGGCGSVNATGTIIVTAANTAGAPSSSPTLCINTALTNITIATTGATGISNDGTTGANSLPAGVSAHWSGNTITISGTPTAAGTFNYSIPLTGGCGSVNATGTIIVNPNAAISLTSAGGTNAQTLCINTAITSITYSVSGGGTGAGATGLPTGVNGSYSGGVFTISGTPSASGTFNYTVTTTGTCSQTAVTGSIVVLQTTGTTSYWNGNTSGLWATSANWCGTVPSCSQSAVIPSGTINSPTISAAGAACLNLTINSGATLIMSTTNTLGICGDWVNNGTFTPGSGTVYFIGTANQAIGGTGTQPFYNLTINNTGVSGSDNITLSKPVTVSHQLTLTDGIVNTDATNLITLSTSATTNSGNAGSYVSGPMRWNGLNGAGPFVFPTGKGSSKWARVALSGVTASTDFTCQYFNSSYSNVSSADIATSPTPTLTTVSQKEYWTIVRTSGAGNAAVTLYWEDASFSRINSCATNGDLKVAHYNTGSSNKWENGNTLGTVVVTGTCTGYIGSGTVTSDVMTTFSPFTFGTSGSGVNPLPIELLYFKATYNGATTDLSWKTASEINNDYFTVERSTDGINFTAVGIVGSKAQNGNSTSILDYTLNDPNTAPGVYYYRLKQTDFDFKYEYSSVVVVTITASINFSVELAPNPNDGTQMTVLITTPKSGTIILTINDMLGKLIAVENFEALEGSDNLFLMRFKETLSSATYIVTATLKDSNLIMKKRLLIAH